MRIWIILAFLSLTLDAFDYEPISTEIINVNSHNKTISFKSEHLQVGQSGIILTNQQNYEIIIASARIQSIQKDIAIAEYTPFESISQRYLPTPRAEPSKGDSIIFSSFYDQSIAIAPDQETYNKIITLNSHTHFMHIDLFAAFLAKDGINDPQPKHFKAFCNLYSIGLIHILASNGVNILDCQSFEILETITYPVPTLESTQAPFFSRIANIQTGSLASKMRSKKSRQYFSYYDNLLQAPLKTFNQRNRNAL